MNESPLRFVFVLMFSLVLPRLGTGFPTYTTIFSYPFTNAPGSDVSSKPIEGLPIGVS